MVARDVEDAAHPHGRRFSMSELVERVDVPAATIRFYLGEGLLPPPAKVAANRFLYDERHEEIIRVVRLLRERRGLTLDVIRSLLPDLLPDLAGSPDPGGFRPEMWHQVLAAYAAREAAPPLHDRLVEAGVAAFGHHGFAEVSVDDVCRAVGIAKGTFYRAFDSKAELFFAVVDVVGSRIAGTMLHLAGDRAERDSIESRLAAAIGPYLTILLDVASLAHQRRPGHSRALRGALAEISRAVGACLGERDEDSCIHVVEVGIARAVGRIGDEVVSLAGIAEATSTDSPR